MTRFSALCGLLVLGGPRRGTGDGADDPNAFGPHGHSSAQIRSDGSAIHYPNRPNEAPYNF